MRFRVTQELERSFIAALGTVLVAVAGARILGRTLLAHNASYQAALVKFALVPTENTVQAAYDRHFEGDTAGAVKMLETALRHDPASPYRWADYAEMLLEAGRIEESRSAIARAAKLGPYMAPVQMRIANYYVRTREPLQSLPYTKHLLGLVADFDDSIFALYDRAEIPASTVLANGLPASPRPAQSYFRHLLSMASNDGLAQTWRWMSVRNLVDDRTAAAYVGYLVKSHEPLIAQAAWHEHTAKRDPEYPERNLLFNGDFELEPTASAFDWTITSPEGATAQISSEAVRSGHHSLEIDFDGTTNLSYGHIRQLTAVGPGSYLFRAAIRVEGITTDKGVGFRISDAEDARRLDLRTEPLSGTADWQTIEHRFAVPAETRCLRVSVYRDASLKFDCKIAGKVWIDSLRLLPE